MEYEMYLLGSQKCLRHGRDTVALDYEMKSIVLGLFGDRPFGPSRAGIDMRNDRQELSKLENQGERG